MKKYCLKKCLLAFGLFLFLTIFFPIPVAGNLMIAHASTVSGEQSEIKLNVKSKSIVKDTSYSLKIYNILDSYKATYKSADTAIASVDENGVIKAVDFGTTKIIVTVKDGFKTLATLECEVTVGPPAIYIKLTKSEITLTVGSKTSLTAILTPNNTVEEARFSSNDQSIASVSTGGRITAKSVGVTYIFASIGNGKYDMCKVTVVEETASPEQTTSGSNTESKGN